MQPNKPHCFGIFPKNFWNERAKNSIGDLSKCRVYTEIADANRSQVAMNGKSTNRSRNVYIYIYIGLYIAIYIGL